MNLVMVVNLCARREAVAAERKEAKEEPKKQDKQRERELHREEAEKVSSSSTNIFFIFKT